MWSYFVAWLKLHEDDISQIWKQQQDAKTKQNNKTNN